MYIAGRFDSVLICQAVDVLDVLVIKDLIKHASGKKKGSHNFCHDHCNIILGAFC